MRCVHQWYVAVPLRSPWMHLGSCEPKRDSRHRKRDQPDATTPGGDEENDERAHKRRATLCFESLIPNEILAMMLALVRPADVPAVRRVARRWRDLAPPAEPDVVVAALDAWCMGFAVAPRSKAKQRYLNRLRVEAAGAFVDDNDAGDIRDVYHDFYGLGKRSLTL